VRGKEEKRVGEVERVYRRHAGVMQSHQYFGSHCAEVKILCVDEECPEEVKHHVVQRDGGANY